MVLATRRMELWATFANTALRSSLKREDPSLAAPSGVGEGGGELEADQRKVYELQ